MKLELTCVRGRGLLSLTAQDRSGIRIEGFPAQFYNVEKGDKHIINLPPMLEMIEASYDLTAAFREAPAAVQLKIKEVLEKGTGRDLSSIEEWINAPAEQPATRDS